MPSLIELFKVRFEFCKVIDHRRPKNPVIDGVVTMCQDVPQSDNPMDQPKASVCDSP
jgi:hypothetical protein